jgi:hypothetical protein
LCVWRVRGTRGNRGSRGRCADPGRGTVHAAARMLHPNKFDRQETDDVKDVGRAAWRGRPGAGRAPPAGLPDRSRQSRRAGAKREGDEGLGGATPARRGEFTGGKAWGAWR